MTARTRWMTFDCYGTLVDWQTAFAGTLGPLVGDKAGAVLRACHAHARLLERERPHRSYKDVLESALAQAALEQGVELPASAARVLEDAWPLMHVFDDVEPMLAELRARRWRLAVLTNCDDDLFAITLAMFQLPFDFVLTAERVRGYKPDSWHFRGFERLLGVRTSQWVHVANSRYHDITPAQDLGIPHLWLDRERTGEPGVANEQHVHSAVDVPDAAERLIGGGPCEDEAALGLSA